MIKDLKGETLKKRDKEQLNNICEECRKKDQSVSQNLILTGFKICESCRTLKMIFPV